jgi:hypothetical protein
MSLLVQLLQGAAQLAGVAGFGLGVQSYRVRKFDAARAEQREKRVELRELLFDVRDDFNAELRYPPVGGEPISTPSESLENAVAQLPRFEAILETPNPVEVHILYNHLETTLIYWQNLQPMDEPEPESGIRSYEITYFDLTEKMRDAIPLLQKCILAITDANKSGK